MTDYTLYGATPGADQVFGSNGIATGLEFYVTEPGLFLKSIRYYRLVGAAAQLATIYRVSSGLPVSDVATFANNTPTGWQEGILVEPFALEANVRYRAVVVHPDGTQGVYKSAGLSAEKSNGPLVAPASSASTNGNGTYSNGGSNSMRDATNSSGNSYGIDVTVGEPDPPPVDPGEPGPTPIVWDDPDERYFTTGVDHGVLFPKSGPAVPWNGIIGVTEAGGGDTSILYRDGIIYHTEVSASDYSGSLSAFFWPDEFSECIGMPQVAPGFIADYQEPKAFDLSYRSLVGSGTRGDMFGHQIHLIYNAVASMGQRTRKTMTDTPAMDEYTFDLSATPVHIKGLRPTAHFILDTRGLDPSLLSGLEYTMYTFGIMPDPAFVYDLLKYSGVMFTYLLQEDGSVLISGPGKHYPTQGYGMELDPATGKLSLFNAVAEDNGDGSYTFSDGPS